MAVWKKTVAGCEVKIHNVDHPPPHCHVRTEHGTVKVELRTLEILDPPPHALPVKLRRGLVAVQEDLLEAWERVTVIPPGSSPGVW